MPSQLIFTSRYIRSGTKKSKARRANYTKYIATRKSVEKRPQSNTAVTANQTQLINQLLKEFPIAKTYLEYEDYSAKPTAENASELISTIIERHADVIGNRKNFVDYMAKRPGAERRGDHGLFNDSDAPIDLNAVANEVANHPGNVWTHVVSLRREDAVRLGYTNSDMWRELVKRHIKDIADAQKIPLANLKWYAAFHNTTHHPHIHLLVYSTNPRQGFLTNEGIEKIRSKFANDIFQDELKSIYQEQTMRRNELKAMSENQMKEIVSEIGAGDIDERLAGMVMQLYDQLQTVKGKKVYGYLPKEVKQSVDNIFDILAQNEHVAKLYDKWCELEKLKYKTYTLKPQTFPPLTENKEFRSIRNMIIKIVLKLHEPIIDNFDPVPPEPKEAFKLSDIVNNKHGLYKYGKALLLGDDVAPSSELGENLLMKAIDAGNVNAKRYLAGEYISGEHLEQDIDKGIDMLSELADSGDALSAYRFGKIYMQGDAVYADLDKAEQYLSQASDAGNEYAIFALAKLYLLEEKKDLSKVVELLEKALEYNSVKPYASYTYAKVLLDNNEFHNTAKAVQLLEEAASGNSWCSYLLGKLYLFGTPDLEKDTVKAKEWLTASADDGNEQAEALAKHAEDNDQAMLTLCILSLFSHISRIIRDDYVRSQNRMQPKVDKKLRQEIQRKKQELGLKADGLTIQLTY